jgi:hypothetical protein
MRPTLRERVACVLVQGHDDDIRCLALHPDRREGAACGLCIHVGLCLHARSQDRAEPRSALSPGLQPLTMTPADPHRETAVQGPEQPLATCPTDAGSRWPRARWPPRWMARTTTPTCASGAPGPARHQPASAGHQTRLSLQRAAMGARGLVLYLGTAFVLPEQGRARPAGPHLPPELHFRWRRAHTVGSRCAMTGRPGACSSHDGREPRHFSNTACASAGPPSTRTHQRIRRTLVQPHKPETHKHQPVAQRVL